MHKNIADNLIDAPPFLEFANLEELHVDTYFPHNRPSPNSHPLLRTVASQRLRRVIVEVRGRITTFSRWESLDGTLAGLVERHNAYGIPQLQISSTADPERIRQLLPRVAREGVLEVRLSGMSSR